MSYSHHHQETSSILVPLAFDPFITGGGGDPHSACLMYQVEKNQQVIWMCKNFKSLNQVWSSHPFTSWRQAERERERDGNRFLKCWRLTSLFPILNHDHHSITSPQKLLLLIIMTELKERHIKDKRKWRKEQTIRNLRWFHSLLFFFWWWFPFSSFILFLFVIFPISFLVSPHDRLGCGWCSVITWVRNRQSKNKKKGRNDEAHCI